MNQSLCRLRFRSPPPRTGERRRGEQLVLVVRLPGVRLADRAHDVVRGVDGVARDVGAKGLDELLGRADLR